MSDLIDSHRERLLSGSDQVTPNDQDSYLRIQDMCAPLPARLTPGAREKPLKENRERVFEDARRKVRAWEKTNVR